MFSREKVPSDGIIVEMPLAIAGAWQEEGKGRSQCWGTNYRAAPEILHGYTESWKNKKSHEMSTEERLDLRCGGKADKFCK